MKLKSLALLIFAFAIGFTSCTKTTTQTIITHDTTTIITRDTLINRDTIVVANPKNPIVGLWIGTLTAINEPQAGPLQYSFDIRADSTILTESEGADGNTYYSAGTWTLIGATFSAVITSTSAANRGTVQKLTATYSNTNGTLSSGIWGDALGNANGTFSLNRIN